MKTLSDRLDEVKDEHAAETVNNLAHYHDEKAKATAYFILGRLRQNDSIAKAVSENLLSQTIRVLERFQREKQHEVLGFATFDQFLNESEYSPMTKRQYYDRLTLVRGHGDEIYDLMTSIGISVRSQKMLGNGELSIKDDTLFVGDKEIEIANTGIIKDVLNELFDEKREMVTANEKLAKTVAAQKTQIKRGTDEINEIRRNFDALNEGDPYDKALSHAIHSLLELTYHIGHLDDEKKAAKGGDAMDTLWVAMLSVRKSYGVNFPFRENLASQTSKTSETSQTSQTGDLVDQVLAEDDDFGDEEEA